MCHGSNPGYNIGIILIFKQNQRKSIFSITDCSHAKRVIISQWSNVAILWVFDPVCKDYNDDFLAEHAISACGLPYDRFTGQVVVP